MSSLITALLASEDKIECGQFTMIEGLREIIDQETYKATHKTFEAYVKDRWAMSASRAYQMVRALDVKEDLCTNCTHPRLSEIKTEGQLRELVEVPTEDLPKVLKKIFSIAGDSRPTAQVIKQARDSIYQKSLPAPEPKPEKSKPKETPIAGTNQTLLDAEPECSVVTVDEPSPIADSRAMDAKRLLAEALRKIPFYFGNMGLGGQADIEVQSLKRKAGLL